MRPAYILPLLLVPGATLALTRTQAQNSASAHENPAAKPGRRFAQAPSPIDSLPPAPGTNPTPVPARVYIQPVPVPTATPRPTVVPTPAPPSSQMIRVGLSTAGGPVQFYSSGALGLSDPTQPGRRMVIPAGQRLQVVRGAPTSVKAGTQTFTGPLVLQTGGAASEGWGALSIFVTAQPARFSSNGTNPKWGRPYRGHFEVWPQRSPEPNHRKGDLTVINRVPLEEYLKGVVPWEMSPTAPLEALKAQAICARTKTLQLVAAKTFASGGFDVCDYDACQGYPGTENEKPRTTLAVRQTEGLALFYNNRPIDAVYGTNSGGITASAGDVWKSSSPAPYLQSVRDFSSSSPLVKGLKAEMTEADWLAYCSQPWPSYAQPDEGQRRVLSSRRATSPFASRLFGPDDWPEFYRWKRFITVEEAVQAFADRGFGEVTGFEVALRTPSGHIRQLRVLGNAPQRTAPVLDAPPAQGVTAPEAPPPTPVTIVLDGDAAVRSMFSKRLGSTTALPSSTFVVSPQVDATGRLTGWLLQGAGWGHGVGMCQRGAQNHAEEGWDARRILNWYYRGVELRDISP